MYRKVSRLSWWLCMLSHTVYILNKFNFTSRVKPVAAMIRFIETPHVIGRLLTQIAKGKLCFPLPIDCES